LLVGFVWNLERVVEIELSVSVFVIP